jgi:hypothetical protein
VTVWTLIRRPLLLLLVMGCFVSAEASGRFSVRLIVDGAISFAFLPLFEIASLGIVARGRERGMTFVDAVDRFFGTDTSWLLWVVAMIAIRAVESPQLATAPPQPLFWALAGSMLVPMALTARADLQLFRSTIAPSRPVRALIVQRSIAWTGALVYFFGTAGWAYLVGYLS